MRRLECSRCRRGSGALEFNFADLFECVADEVPERDAVVCGDQRLTYAELDDAHHPVRARARGLGIGTGDHVGLYLRNTVEHLEAMLALLQARARCRST